MWNSVGAGLFERRRASKLNYIVNAALILLVLFLVAEISFNMRYTSILVDGRSMLPTLVGAENGEGGDFIFIDTTISPTYGDIVVVRRADGSFIIKRVVAFGGDTVKSEAGVLSIKYKGSETFEDKDEPYLSPEYNRPELLKNSFSEHLVEEGKMFLLGDNRNESADSRLNGDYPLKDVVGVVPEWALRRKAQITAFYTYFKTHSIQITG